MPSKTQDKLPDKYKPIADMVRPYVSAHRQTKNDVDLAGTLQIDAKKEIPEALPHWLFLFERITRSIGKVAHVEHTRKQPTSSTYPPVKDKDGYYTLVLTDLGYHLAHALSNFSPARIDENSEATVKENYPELRWNPRLNLLFDSAKEREFTELLSCKEPTRRVHLVRICDGLNGYANQVREHANSSRFREKLKAFVRIPNDNYRWLKSLVDECFVGHDRLLFSCVDLYYPSETGAETESLYPQVKNDAKELRNCLDNGPFKDGDVLGYGLSLRYIPVIGYHFRLLLICAPKNEGPSDWLAREVKKIWTQLAGLTSNVLDHFGIMLTDLKRDDEHRRKVLDKHVYFLTQLDSLVRPKLAPKDPYFFRGGKRR